MAGYACWYNLQQIFSWLAAMGWQVILHTGVTTRSDLLQRFLQLAANHFPPATLNSWRFVWHWSPQASEAARRAAPAAAARGPSSPAAAAAAGDLAPLCSQRSRERSAVPLAAAGRGGFSRLPRQMPTNSWIWPEADSSRPGLQRTLSAAQAAADPQRPAPASAQPAAVAALLEYADRRYAGYQRPLFRGALLMDNLLGVADRGLAGGLLVKFRPPGRSSRQRQARYLQPGAALSARPAAPGLLGTLALAAAARRDPRFTIKTCCCSTTGVTTSCCCAIRWSTIPGSPAKRPLSSASASPTACGCRASDGSWRIKQHLFDQHHGALFPLVDAFRSRSGPDAEDYQWLMHQARPALSVDEAEAQWLLAADRLAAEQRAGAVRVYPQSPTAP